MREKPDIADERQMKRKGGMAAASEFAVRS